MILTLKEFECFRLTDEYFGSDQVNFILFLVIAFVLQIKIKTLLAMNLNYQKIVVVLCPLSLFSLLSLAQAPPVAWTQYWNASQAVIGFEVKVDNQSNILFA